MLVTCSHAQGMSRMIQTRHVPDELHRKLKARAALEGLTLSDYLLRETQRAAERPTKYSTSSGTSSSRWRSGGAQSGTTASR